MESTGQKLSQLQSKTLPADNGELMSTSPSHDVFESVELELVGAQKIITQLKEALDSCRIYNQSASAVINDYRKLIDSHEVLCSSHQKLKKKHVKALDDMQSLLAENRSMCIQVRSLRSTIAWLTEKTRRADRKNLPLSGKENLPLTSRQKRVPVRPAFF